MNNVSISGTIGKPVDIIKKNNHELLSNTICITDHEEKYTWVNIVAYGEVMTHFSNNYKEGDFVEIVGKLRTRSFEDKEGNKRYITEVIVLRMEEAS